MKLEELKKQIPSKEERLKMAKILELREECKVTDNIKNMMYMDKEYIEALEIGVKELNSLSSNFKKVVNKTFSTSTNIENLDEKPILKMLEATSTLEDISEEIKNIFKRNYGTYIKSNEEIIKCSKRDFMTLVHIAQINAQYSRYLVQIDKLLKSSLLNLKGTLEESFVAINIASEAVMNTIYHMGHEVFKYYMNNCDIVRI